MSKYENELKRILIGEGGDFLDRITKTLSEKYSVIFSLIVILPRDSLPSLVLLHFLVVLVVLRLIEEVYDFRGLSLRQILYDLLGRPN